ncbi:hypothetical protein [Micromonospora globbae]|uniref:hypothetical protein n=1 Tax=Micromonospora globbae TaxID=1894969 RepID=UPI00343137E7
MSRQELAEAVNAYVFAATGRRSALDGSYVGKLERGEHRWPCSAYRQAFRAVLGAATDAELGFYISRRSRGEATVGRTPVAGQGRFLPAHAGVPVLPDGTAMVYVIVVDPEVGTAEVDLVDEDDGLALVRRRHDEAA